MRRYFLAAAAIFLFPACAEAQSIPTPFSYLSAASTNATLVVRGAGAYRSGLFINTTATVYYLKLYDTAAVPTCGAGTPIRRIPIPFGAGPAGGGVMDTPTEGGAYVANGLGFCLTAGIADNDVAVAATGIALNITYK